MAPPFQGAMLVHFYKFLSQFLRQLALSHCSYLSSNIISLQKTLLTTLVKSAPFLFTLPHCCVSLLAQHLSVPEVVVSIYLFSPCFSFTKGEGGTLSILFSACIQPLGQSMPKIDAWINVMVNGWTFRTGRSLLSLFIWEPQISTSVWLLWKMSGLTTLRFLTLEWVVSYGLFNLMFSAF